MALENVNGAIRNLKTLLDLSLLIMLDGANRIQIGVKDSKKNFRPLLKKNRLRSMGHIWNLRFSAQIPNVLIK